jgi:integrase/recombinase XerD
MINGCRHVSYRLIVRRAAGFPRSNSEYLLRGFAGFASERQQKHIRTAAAIDWASDARSVAQQHTRYQTIYRFAQYLRAEDSRHESPPTDHFGYRKTRRIPHIYSREEIAGLVLAATTLPSSDSLRSRTCAALIKLFGATGLRISEALHLLVSDITPNGLLIRRTKFQKTRLVPLHDTAVTGLAQSRHATQWRSCFRFGRGATSRVLESSQGVPGSAEIGGSQALRRSIAAHT